MLSQIPTEEYISNSRRIRQSLRTGDILLVDDDSTINEVLFQLCRSVGEKALKVTSIEAARWYIETAHQCIKLAIIDYCVNGDFADVLIEQCQEYNIPCVIHTGRKDMLRTLEDRYPGIIILLKPSPIERILKEIL